MSSLICIIIWLPFVIENVVLCGPMCSISHRIKWFYIALHVDCAREDISHPILLNCGSILNHIPSLAFAFALSIISSIYRSLYLTVFFHPLPMTRNLIHFPILLMPPKSSLWPLQLPANTPHQYTLPSKTPYSNAMHSECVWIFLSFSKSTF